MDNVINRRSCECHPSLLERRVGEHSSGMDGRVVTDVDVINGCYKFSWRERIGFCSGDLAQNLIYQTVSIWSHPRWGKYRSWLVLGAVLLSTFAALCFWNGFSGSLLYAYVTYVGMSMSFTFVNVPYAALGSSLTRDTDEITILTSVRMVMANLAGLIIKTLPLVIVLFAPKVLNPQTGEMEPVYNTPEAGGAWFITMSIFALVGLVLLYEGRYGAWRCHTRTGSCLGGLQSGRVGADTDGRTGHPLACHPDSGRPVRIGHLRDWQI